jgi:high affinity Mn2+ porin
MKLEHTRRNVRFLLALACGLAAVPAPAQDAEVDRPIELHLQSTYLYQSKPAFPSPYSGPKSLGAAAASSYSFTSTMFLGARLRDGLEIYFNPEVTQGVPFSQLQGTAGFTNGELTRTSGPDPSLYTARAFLRKTWDLGGEFEEQASEANQVTTRYAAERFVVTAGVVSVLDVFDAVDYSRDARTQFMNWASLTYGAWDFPADARGYTRGIAAEYISPSYSLRAGRFAMPSQSNGLRLDGRMGRHFGDVAEAELPFKLAGRDAALRLLVFHNRAVMGSFDDAIAAGGVPDVSTVRKLQSKSGVGAGVQAELAENIGGYVRASWNDGKTETFAFTEIDRSLSGGVLAKGERWSRAGDSAGAALYLNGLGRAHRDYLAAGGQGFFLGDGRLNYSSERIVELFYSLHLGGRAWLSGGYQRIANPGYNQDRGPANFYGLRFHTNI